MGRGGADHGRRGRRRAAALAPLALALLVSASAHAAGPALFRVGAAVRSIDPTVPVYSGGFGYSPPITRVRDPLQVRAFYVSNGRHAVAVVTVDSQAYFSGYQEGPDYGITAVRADAAAAIDAASTGPAVGQGDIIVQGTHSHAAPTLEGIWGPVPLPYLKEVHDQAVAAIVAAAAAARPAYLQVGTLDDHNLAAVNVNQDDYQGWVNDPQLSVLRAVSPSDGSTVALLASVPVHGAHICGQCDSILSADYFGAVRAALDSELGGIAVVGPATLGREESPVETTGADNMEWLSGVIANDVLEAIGHARWVTDPTVAATESMVQIPASNAALLTLNDEWSLPDDVKAQQGATTGVYPIDRANTPPYRTGNVMGTWLTALRIGDTALLSMPGEPFPEIRLALARATGARTVIALSKGQDDFGYFYPSFVEPFPELYNSDHAIFNIAPQAGDQILQGQLANLATIGFSTTPTLAGPLPNDYAQKLRPGLQTLASPPTGDADRSGRFTSTLQAIYMPASVVDAPLAGQVHWDFGDGTSADTGYLVVGQDYGQTGQGPQGTPRFTHAFPVGTHTVVARGHDTDGNPVSWTITVTVHPRLRLSASCAAARSARTARFAARASGGEGTILRWSWTFAGGGSAAGPQVTHRFAAGRARSATVSALDAAGGTASATARCRTARTRHHAAAHRRRRRGARFTG